MRPPIQIDYLKEKHQHSTMRAIQEIRREVMGLLASERASLAHDIVLSLDDPADFELSPAQESEIQRRVERVREGIASARAAVDVLADITARS